MVVSLQSRSQDQCHFPGKDTVELYENDAKQLFSVYKIQVIQVSKPLASQESSLMKRPYAENRDKMSFITYLSELLHTQQEMLSKITISEGGYYYFHWHFSRITMFRKLT